MDSIIITLLLIIAFVLLVIFRIRSWSLGREILSNLNNKKPFGNMDIGFNLKTMSLKDEEILKYPKNVQESIRKKRKADNFFFIIFVIIAVLLVLKFI